MQRTPTIDRLINAGLGLAAVVLVFSLSRLGTVRADRDDSLLPAPYTAVLIESAKDQNGDTKLRHEYTFAVRADGASLFRLGGPLGQEDEHTSRNIWLRSGVEVRVFDERRMKSSQVVGVIPPRTPSRKCALAGSQERFLSEETLAGYRVARVGQGPRSSWYALDYGCSTIKEIFDWRDGRVSEKALMSLVNGEPTPALFDIPADYAEVSPSALLSPKENAAAGGASENPFPSPIPQDARAFEKVRPGIQDAAASMKPKALLLALS